MKITKFIITFSLLFFKNEVGAFTVDNIIYTVTDSTQNEVTVSGSNSSITDLFIPSSVSFEGVDYSVKSIANRAFYVKDLNWPNSLNSVIISEGVRSIGNEAFSDCIYLSTIILPKSLESIGYRAFWRCSRLSSISAYCKTIGREAFQACKKLTSVHLSEDITSIGANAFNKCQNLTSVTILGNVFSVNDDAFKECDNLTKAEFCSVSCLCNCTFDNEYSNPLSYAGHLFVEGKEITELSVPDDVMTIPAYSFEGCIGLRSVSISDSVKSIGFRAFARCDNIETVTIGSSVMDIKDDAFYNCKKLSKAEFGGIEILCKTIFGNSYSNPLMYSGHLYIKGEEVTSLEIPNTVTSINSYAFEGCVGLSSVEIPSNVLAIGNKVFSNNKNLSVVKSKIEQPFVIGENAFFNISPNAVLTVPKGTKDLYKSNYSWSSYFSDVDEFNVIISVDDINYVIMSETQKTVHVANGEYDKVLNVPATIKANNFEWKVIGIEEDARNRNGLSAIIWNSDYPFTGSVSNPNLLLYVNSKNSASNEIKNVIINNKADNIELTDAAGGNNFYCPRAFTAAQVTYGHNYKMKTGYNTCQGWETIVLPFDVAVITNNVGTELVPYALWGRGDSKRPFWLYSMNEDGWKSESAIKANVPYIISMPNNENYDATYNISGNIVFSASNVKVESSENLTSSKSNHKNLVPNYQNQESSNDIYALNVNNLWDKYTETDLAEGSAFIRGLRQVRPFEAYMTIDSGGSATRSISIFGDGNTTGIMDIPTSDNDGIIKIFSLSGALLKQGKREDAMKNLPKGIYIINNKKVVVK